MNVLLMADMEGVAGITVWDQVSYGAPFYEECRRLYTEEINAAARGCFQAGAERVVAVDCHGAGGDASFNSWIPEMMHPELEWVAHHKWCGYTEMFETGCDCAMMIGMHAKANTPDGVLCHTISTTTWYDLKFNGTSVGEFGINAALCGHHDVPVILISGDEATCDEGQDLLGNDLYTVAVKKGLTRYSARHLSPHKARDMIEEGAKEALTLFKEQGIGPKPYLPSGPCEITVDLSTCDTSKRFENREGVEMVTPMQAVSRAGDWYTAWNQVWHD